MENIIISFSEELLKIDYKKKSYYTTNFINTDNKQKKVIQTKMKEKNYKYFKMIMFKYNYLHS